MFTLIFNAIWLFMPSYTPNNFAVITGGGKPIDLGRNFIDGKRILGDGKTFRGFAGGFSGGIATGIIQYQSEKVLNFHIFTSLSFDSAIYLFILLSAGSLFGDMAGSFVKRRLGFERGRKVPLLDQLDFLVFSIILASFHSSFFALYTPEVILVGIVITPILHRLTNLIAYILRLKDVPW